MWGVRQIIMMKPCEHTVPSAYAVPIMETRLAHNYENMFTEQQWGSLVQNNGSNENDNNCHHQQTGQYTQHSSPGYSYAMTSRAAPLIVLTGAVLTGAVLTGAILTGAVLTGNVLTGAVLTGAVLTGVATLYSTCYCGSNVWQ